jgi:CPA1 family monovalent cation:H+ antiporter
VLLGLQIPAVTGVIFRDPAFSNYQAIGHIFIISFTLILLRFLWIYLFWLSTHAWSNKKILRKPSFRDSVLTSLSGVRGAVTLAAAFSIPYALQDGSPFPQRDLIIFLAAGVILVTLLTASFVLPLISKREKEDGEEARRKNRQTARVAIMQVAIQAVKEEMNEENKEASSAVISDYNRLIQEVHRESTDNKTNPQLDQLEVEIRLKALTAERKEVKRLYEEGQISRRTSAALHRKIDHMETALSGTFHLRLFHIAYRLRRLLVSLFRSRRHTTSSPSSIVQDLVMIKETKLKTSKAAIEAVRKQIHEDNELACQVVISSYAEVINRISLGHQRQVPRDKQFNQHKKEIQLKAIQVERNEVQAQFEQGLINRETANHLRKAILYTEAAMLENNEFG